MRNKGFIAEHRGGPLKKEQHRQLIEWACNCVEHVLPLAGNKSDPRLEKALLIAKEWQKGNSTVGDARKASLGAIALANESPDMTLISIARAAGHAVATAHMADHALGAALYSLKAVKKAGKSSEEEKKWQDEQLPAEIKKLVLDEMSKKEISFKL